MNFLVIFMLLLPATVSSYDMRKNIDHCKDWSRKIVRCRRHILVKGYGGPRKFVRIMVRISWRSFLRRYRFNPKFPDLHDMFYKVDQRICPPDIFAYTCSLNIATCTHTFHIGMPLRPCRETCMNFATACKDKYVSPSLHMTVGFLRHNCRYLPFYDENFACNLTCVQDGPMITHGIGTVSIEYVLLCAKFPPFSTLVSVNLGNNFFVCFARTVD